MNESNVERLFAKWKTTGSPEVEADWLDARLKSKQLPGLNIRIAADLGHLAAGLVSLPRYDLEKAVVERERCDPRPVSRRELVTEVCRHLSVREIVAFCRDCAVRVAVVWESFKPSDTRPQEAIDAASSWLSGKLGSEIARTAGDAAFEAAEEAMGSVTDGELPKAHPAISAAKAASDAAKAADSASSRLWPPVESAARRAGYVAAFCLAAVSDTASEARWQNIRLSGYLLTEYEAS